MLKRILNAKSKTITSAAFILSLATFTSAVLGLLREKLLAHFFGAGDIVDMYSVAFRIPDTVFLLLVAGTLSAGFIPVFTSYLEKQKQSDAFALASNVLNILMTMVLTLSIILFFAAPVILKLMVPGWALEKVTFTVALTRILLLQPILLALSNLFAGVLKSLRHFFIISLSPIIYNLSIIIGILFFYDIWGLKGLVYSVVLGALLHLTIQIPTLIASGWRWQPIWNFKDTGFKRIARMAPMRSLTLLIPHLATFVITGIASTLGSGAIAIYFNYAGALRAFPITIFGLSFATAAFPFLSSWSAKQDWRQFAVNFSNTARQIIFFLIPISAFMFVLRAQVVRVLYGSGQFDWQATIGTLDALGYFTLGMAALGLALLLLHAFYALEDSATPLIWTVIAVIVNILAAFWLAPILGVKGLALAFSLAAILKFLCLWLALRKKLPALRSQDKEMIVSSIRILFISIISALGVHYMLYILDNWLNTHTGLGILTQGLLAGIAGIVIYIALAMLLHSPELSSIRRFINQKFNGLAKE